jgi:hypothetical protein
MKEENELKAAARVLSRFTIAPRGNTTSGRQDPHAVTRITVNLPTSTVTALDSLGGARSHHVELAVKLYLKIKNAT